MRRTQYLAVEHARQSKIVGKVNLTRRLGVAVNARKGNVPTGSAGGENHARQKNCVIGAAEKFTSRRRARAVASPRRMWGITRLIRVFPALGILPLRAALHRWRKEPRFGLQTPRLRDASCRRQARAARDTACAIAECGSGSGLRPRSCAPVLRCEIARLFSALRRLFC